jgi:hypothetical protein
MFALFRKRKRPTPPAPLREDHDRTRKDPEAERAGEPEAGFDPNKVDPRIVREIDAIKPTDDLTSPLLVKPGERVNWRGAQLAVVIRTDLVEDGVRWVQLLVGEEPNDVELDVRSTQHSDGSQTLSAIPMHSVQVDPARGESRQLTIGGTIYEFVRETRVRYRQVGLENYVVTGTYRFRYFANGDDVVRCSTEEGYDYWLAEGWKTSDADDITTVQAWSGSSRPFKRT